MSERHGIRSGHHSGPVPISRREALRRGLSGAAGLMMSAGLATGAPTHAKRIKGKQNAIIAAAAGGGVLILLTGMYLYARKRKKKGANAASS